ncbi:hypothetical protein M0R88_02355 [Halorussus gelatinilyticus]|uniref:Uncharacterized protein n=1 Tax=Halorussus gelatinilyticus TaxID=2937524 RepID=A0A8U0IKV3_9EURY|nr:hypothetical protein [Halorussus gelatinilyticus]UPW00952.1 hypothetical protein M0R88_02355 [Halorussus gelatinilyticus]
MTDYHDYNTPEEGATDWHVPLNENFEKIDGDVEIRDEEANRSKYTPKAGAKFLATDTEAEYLGDGSEWKKLATSGKSPSFDSVTTGEFGQTTDSGSTRRKLLDTVSGNDIDYDSGKLPKFDAYEVNFSVDGGLNCSVNNVGNNQRYDYVTKQSGAMAEFLSRQTDHPTGMKKETGSNWSVFQGVGSGTLLVHGPKQAREKGTFFKTTATVTVTSRPSATVLESGVVLLDDLPRSLQLSGGKGKLNVYGVDYVR